MPRFESVIGQQPRFALVTPHFRFRALVSFAGRASLGGDREVAMACLVAGRLAAGMLPPLNIAHADAKGRSAAARPCAVEALMSNRKTALFYLVPAVLTSLLVGMVLASRFGLSPTSTAQTVTAPPMNSAPLTGTVSASTFRDIAKNVSPAVVNIRTESRQPNRDLTQFFGGDDLFERFGLPAHP